MVTCQARRIDTRPTDEQACDHFFFFFFTSLVISSCFRFVTSTTTHQPTVVLTSSCVLCRPCDLLLATNHVGKTIRCCSTVAFSKGKRIRGKNRERKSQTPGNNRGIHVNDVRRDVVNLVIGMAVFDFVKSSSTVYPQASSSQRSQLMSSDISTQ
mgnify:CR=1 FL=1